MELRSCDLATLPEFPATHSSSACCGMTTNGQVWRRKRPDGRVVRAASAVLGLPVAPLRAFSG
jgi:hypothetical protein